MGLSDIWLYGVQPQLFYSTLDVNSHHNIYLCGFVYQTNPNFYRGLVASTSNEANGNFRKETLIPFYDSSFPLHEIVSPPNELVFVV